MWNVWGQIWYGAKPALWKPWTLLREMKELRNGVTFHVPGPGDSGWSRSHVPPSDPYHQCNSRWKSWQDLLKKMPSLRFVWNCRGIIGAKTKGEAHTAWSQALSSCCNWDAVIWAQKWIGHCSRTGLLKVDPHLCGQLTFSQGPEVIQWWKGSFHKWSWNNWTSIWKEISLPGGGSLGAQEIFSGGGWECPCLDCGDDLASYTCKKTVKLYS